MDPKVYYIIAAVAVVFSIYITLVLLWVRKRKANQLRSFEERHVAPLSEEQRRLLVFGAILFYHRGEKILDIKPSNGLDVYVHGLKTQWGISNPAEAKETLNDLLMLKRSRAFHPALQQPSAELGTLQQRIAKGLGIELSTVAQTRSAYAWDVCRAVALAKWCYWCGYLSEAETWSFMRQAADTAGQHGRDWTDYTISFLLGRTMQGFDLDDLIVESTQLLKSQHPLLRKVEDVDVYQRHAF